MKELITVKKVETNRDMDDFVTYADKLCQYLYNYSYIEVRFYKREALQE